MRISAPKSEVLFCRPRVDTGEITEEAYSEAALKDGALAERGAGFQVRSLPAGIPLVVWLQDTRDEVVRGGEERTNRGAV